MEVNLLGPVEVRTAGATTPLAPLERNLFALLALSPGKVLSTERIIDCLWGENPPAAPRSRVQGLVSSLRRKIGDVLLTRRPGYLLDLPTEATDLTRCEELARLARHSDTPERTAELLRQALALWRGAPLDGVGAPGMEGDRARLSEWHTGLMEDRYDAELLLGKHTELVAELVAAVMDNPLREKMCGQLMLALYRSNRRADALRVYRELRTRLADELGSDPCADIQQLHGRILRGEDLPSSPVPAVVAPLPGPVAPPEPAAPRPFAARLPPGVGHFTGRDADLAALTAAVPDSDAEPRVLVVTGAGGLGKTALAVHWAHSMTHRFPDGQIFVELSGADDPADSAFRALGTILSVLDTEPPPNTLDCRVARYRALLHDRRMLVVADNVTVYRQLLPLVPPRASSLLLATSRSRLPALAARHAVRSLVMEPLQPSASHELLAAIVGADRLTGDDTTALVRLCGGWPLALRLVGATLATRPGQSLGSLVCELRDQVDRLRVDDDPRSVGSALAESWQRLPDATGRLFAQLGMLPGSSNCLQLAAAAAGISVLRARRLLDELITANLVVEIGPDRYWLHDMVRRYARRLARRLPDREVILRRVVSWYLAVFSRLAVEREPDVRHPTVVSRPEWAPVEEGDRAAADRFVAAEASNLPDLVQWAHDRDDHELTWQLVSLAHTAGAGLPEHTCRLGLEATVTLDDRRAIGEAKTRLGITLLRDPRRREEAEEHLSDAVALLVPTDGRMLSLAFFALGSLRANQQRTATARSALDQAVRLMDPGREPLACAVALLTRAQVLVGSGAVEQGHECFAQAVILGEAAVGRQADQFDRGPARLDDRLADAYLAHLSRSLESPRVSTPDHGLAGVFIDLRMALRMREKEEPEMIMAQQILRGEKPVFPQVDRHTAETYRI